jgi:MFS family permease
MAYPVRRVFLGGQVVSLLGDGLAILAIPLLVLQLTGNPLVAGLASAIRSVGFLVVGIPAGPVVDRVTAWKVLVTADVVRATSFTALGVLALRHGPQVALILGVALASACASVFFDSALAVTAAAGLLLIVCTVIAWLATLRRHAAEKLQKFAANSRGGGRLPARR